MLSASRALPGPFCFALIALLVFGGAATAAGREVPAYQGYVNDYASMMSGEVRTKLERALQSFDFSDSTQVAILTIDSLDGDPIEDFSIRVVDQWKIGQQGKDNGVLFLAVKNDRKMRIEVGRGLEHVLTDLAAGRIIDSVVAPRFKAGNFDQGFEAGALAIIKTTRGEYTPQAGGRPGQGGGQPPPLFKYLFFGLAFIAFLGSNSRPLGVAAGSFLVPLIFFLGLPAGVMGWSLLLMLIPLGGLGGLLLPLLLSGMMTHGRGGGYYTSGGGFGGGFGSSGGGFGGFGGGGFGGGGASGGW
ncbi:MAG: TPM domain-containing protein [Desulfobulbaceae bacterium]|nr:TPM domain-containing protein [Desulfobulbaceae bacterium]